MSRIGNLLLAYAFAAAAMDQGRADYALGEDPWCGEDDAHRKQRLHRMNPVDTTEREFNINGERITARDRKTALKIYANRHPETKNKKRKKK